MNERLTQMYRLFQTFEQDSDEETEKYEHEQVSEDVKPNPKPERKPKPEREDEKVVECDIKTHTVGIKKRCKSSSGRKYQCKECDEIMDSMAKLNLHHKDKHSPVKCNICNELFNTPSTLSRHKYKHKECKYSCEQCGKLFPFESDRDLHLNTHRTIKAFQCDRAYYSKGELGKHVKTHENVKWRCTMCKYSNLDERNLKSHMRVHSGLKKYLCPSCLKLFKYNVQLRRHLPCKMKNSGNSSDPSKQSISKLKRSSSPSFD